MIMAAPAVDAGASSAENMPETANGPTENSAEAQKRPQFGTRFLTDPRQVFQHNAWDNVEWSAEQEEAAQKKVQENSQPLPAEKQEEFDNRANEYWNDFYTIHENRFFKDRHWLFTEFPELAPQKKPPQDAEENLLNGEDVGCGVGNTVFPILKTNNDPGLFVYCCDFSSTAVDLVKSNPEYDPSRCHAFVRDMSDESAEYPMPDHSLDVIVLIFVLSALHPQKMQNSINRLARLLKPGGVLLLRDYGRYDMAQLRFKKDELHDLFSSAGLEKVQNLVDRRLQVNRGKQLTMYRVWVQCKYRKVLAPP
ncbi:tRNA N(3)-methylcytidine methyltransferase METTL2 [Labeo rohita]|uniref:tRNA N(3)-cytidine methyltransferase n=1 Tax=Labeo rohita TaxID=84645 RepID=A0ABQ8MUY3_LABRO|nr:tRNA N(3)-methylcytidine methyltransferase METTL2 [Labeo rohita]